MFFGVKFLVRAGWDITHGHEGAGFDVCCCVLPLFSNIDQSGFVFAKESGRVCCGDFVIEHAKSLREDGDIASAASLPGRDRPGSWIEATKLMNPASLLARPCAECT